MSAELKPCPFCGGDASIHAAYEWPRREGPFYVGCDKCPASLGDQWRETEGGHAPDHVFATEAEATAAWNRRAAELDAAPSAVAPAGEVCPYVVTSREGTSYCSLNGPADDDGWRPIESAPRDGTWFFAARLGEDLSNLPYEIGRYNPSKYPRFVPAEGGLYRREEEIGFEWEGFNNIHRATHWRPLPAAPQQEPEVDRG